MQTTVVIDIPVDHYESFVAQCDPWSHHHAILKKGIIVSRPQQGHFERFTKIRCTVHEAKGLLDRAEHIYPQVAPHIKNAIAAARNS